MAIFVSQKIVSISICSGSPAPHTLMTYKVHLTSLNRYMKSHLKKLPYLVLTAALLSSCVSSKKYNALQASKDNLERQKAVSDQKVADANSKIADLQKETSRLRQDTTKVGADLRNAQALYREVSASKVSETSRLSGDLARREMELRNLEQSNQRLAADLKAREDRMKELERVLAEKEKAVANLRNTVSNALLGFKDGDLTVEIKNGKVYVSLAEQLLFKSGSTKVDPKGQEALRKLAGALQGQQDVNVVVEGHTDDVPISRGTAGMQDNWDLSVLRATEITRILTNAGLDRIRVTPSGRADTTPLVAARTPDGRRMNRRTEIILTPKLDELFKILE
jgi:chemotaxis protein MotB